MERVTNYVRGNVRIRVKCTYPERFLNICAVSGVEFWDMERDGSELVFTTHIKDYRYLRRREHQSDFVIVGTKKAGTAVFLWRMRKRYALIAGMALCLGLAWVSSLFIWDISVSGNETVPSAVILAELEKIGVGIGSNRLTLDQDYISNEMLLRVPELCWITVNTKGSRAEVLVREEIPVPEIVDEDLPTLVYAKKSGIIEKMIVLEGKKLIAVGETVEAGDILVTGAMESLSTGKRYVHAMGDIYARTWYTMSAEIMDEMYTKEYTGRTKAHLALRLGDKRVNLYCETGSGWEKYDKTVTENKLTLFGITLPIGLIRETYSEYELRSATAADAKERLKERLVNKLKEEIDDGEIVWTEFTVNSANGVIAVTMTAECVEQIGEIRSLTPEEMANSAEENQKESE